MRLIAIALWGLIFALPASAREFVGVGRISNNDSVLSANHDRWRTGSGVLSFVFASDDHAQLGGFGDVVEFRFRGEVISPENIVTPRVGDRPYAAALSFGVHSHFKIQQTEISLGGDLVVTGAQTGLSDLQSAIHDVLGIPGPSAATLAGRIPDGVHAAATIEIARRFELSPSIEARPFLEFQVGVENLARVGADFHIGLLARGDTMLRDSVTGHRYRIGRDFTPGWAGVVGADVAYVDDSLFLPASSGVTHEDVRARVRAGVHWQSKHIGLFYGLTWMSKEFEAQRDSQTVGTMRLDFKF